MTTQADDRRALEWQNLHMWNWLTGDKLDGNTACAANHQVLSPGCLHCELDHLTTEAGLEGKWLEKDQFIEMLQFLTCFLQDFSFCLWQS